MRTIKAALLGSLLVLACVPAGTDPGPSEEHPPQPPVVDRAPAPVDAATPITVDNLEPGASTVVHYMNLTVVTDDPAAALTRAETVLREHGAEVQHSSSTQDHANLNARVPPERRSKLRAAIAKIGRVSSENNSSNDMGHEIRRLRRREALLREADRRLSAGFSGDPTSGEALALLRELTSREQQNIASQLQSYQQQVGRAQLTISFMKHDPNSPYPGG
jgi:hypothetical protein